MRFRTQDIVLVGLFAALVFIFTYFPIFRIDYGVGYFNLGDIPLLVASTLFSPFLGAFAGGIGAAFGDLLSGYALFIPFTLVAKSFEGFLAGTLFHKIRHPLARYLAIPVGTLFMVATYQVAYFMIDPSYAWAGLWLDLGQALAASIISITLIAVIDQRLKWLKKVTNR